jgi:hypothetical protein
MQTNQFSPFNVTTLTTAEKVESSKLSTLQKINIKNLICNIMEEKLNLPFTPNNPLEYAQREAYLKGEIEILNYLLAMSEEDNKSFNFVE